MRKTNKRLTALLLVFTMIFQLLPIPAFAKERRRIVPISGQAQLGTSALSYQGGTAQTVAVTIPYTANITAPIDMAIITAPTNVVGTATANGMTKYTLAYAPV